MKNVSHRGVLCLARGSIVTSCESGVQAYLSELAMLGLWNVSAWDLTCIKVFIENIHG